MIQQLNQEKDGEKTTVAWCRCTGVESFVEEIEEKYDIIGVNVSGNNLGFVLEEKKND